MVHPPRRLASELPSLPPRRLASLTACLKLLGWRVPGPWRAWFEECRAAALEEQAQQRQGWEQRQQGREREQQRQRRKQDQQGRMYGAAEDDEEDGRAGPGAVRQGRGWGGMRVDTAGQGRGQGEMMNMRASSRWSGGWRGRSDVEW